MKVLSLFDGISCARVALERVGIPVETYYASEIDKYAIQISGKNWPDINHIGDVRDVARKIEDFGMEPIDIIMGGSPCTDLSIIKSKTREGLQGKQSNLFFEYVKILRMVKPKYFLLENNYSMMDEARNIISQELGVLPIMIDSSLVSCQDRKRYYWTNIPAITQPLDKGLVLGDILEQNVDVKYYYNLPFDFHGEDKKVCATLNFKNHEMHKRVFNPKYKVGTLTTCGGGNTQKKVYQNGRVRKLTPLEYERCQTLPDNYTAGVADGHRYSTCGNGWTVDVIAHILSFIPNES
jgi:DNA (cytosine-5)-methyltransferase 3A